MLTPSEHMLLQDIAKGMSELRSLLQEKEREAFTMKEWTEIYPHLKLSTIRKHLKEIGYSKPAKVVLISREDMERWLLFTNKVTGSAEHEERAVNHRFRRNRKVA